MNRETHSEFEDYSADPYKDLFDRAGEVDEEFIEKNIFPLQHFFSQNKPRYRDKVHVQSGGAKKIFKVFDEQTDRWVAYAEPIEQSKEKHEEFFNEARITALLQHPNIISVFEIGTQKKIPYFTMEWKQGENLQTKIDRDYLQNNHVEPNLDLYIHIFSQVLNAIEYAHSKQVIHCDIKPANIQITDSGDVLVCDWGISGIQGHKFSSENESNSSENINELSEYKTIVEVIRGTPGFMSPEQAEPKSQRTQSSSDIYALGAVLYFMITGRAPNEGDSLDTILKNTREGINPHLLRHFSQNKLSISLESIVLKALAKDPKERYHTVKDLKNDIIKFKEGYATQAENANLLTLLKLFYHRQRTLCLITSAFGLAFTLVLSYATYSTKVSELKTLEVNQQLDQALNEARLQMSKFSHIRMFEANYFELNKFFRMFFKNQPPSAEQLDSISNYIQENSFSLHYRTILSLAKYVTLADPSRLDDLRTRGLFEMVSGRYQNAIASFRHHTKDPFIQQLIHINEKYAKKFSGKPVGMSLWKNILQEKSIDQHNPEWIKLNFILMNSFLRQEENHHLATSILKYLFKSLNPTVNDIIFDAPLISEERTLFLQAPKNIDLTFQNEHLFTYFKFRQLKLKGNPLKTIPIQLSELKVIDLSESNLKDLTNLHHFENLQTIIINETLKYLGLDKLPSQVKVIRRE